MPGVCGVLDEDAAGLPQAPFRVDVLDGWEHDPSGSSGAAPETVFYTTINKTPNDGISRGRMLSHSSNIPPDICTIYANVH